MASTGPIKRFIRCLPGLAAAAVLLVVPPFEPTPARSQAFDGDAVRELYRRAERNKVERRSRRQRATEELQRAPAQKPSAPKRRTSQAATQPRPEAIEKQPDAKVVLVIGDFLGGALAEGLNDIFAQDPSIRVVNRADGSSGIVRDDHFNWPNEIGRIMDEEKPAAVVVMLGSNDRQQMKVGADRLEQRSEGWTKEYAARATALATAVESRGTPLIWVGMPPFRQASLTADMLAYNDIYRTTSTAAEADYVDIWDGFVDENGAFITTGPDMNGQQARLRTGDGINLTAAGKRKIAFYAEKPLRKLLGSDADASASLTGPAYTPGVDLRPGAQEPVRVQRTVPIALTDPELDGGTALLGGDEARASGTAADRQMREQRQAGTQAGRADDFSAPAAKAAATTAAATATEATAPTAPAQP